MDFDMSAEDIKVFLDEAEDQLQVMEAGILRLERDGQDAELLQEIFRAAHTLKGSSATLGHKSMAEVTHAMENILDKLRRARLVASRAVVDTLFAALDVLIAFKEEIASGEESGVNTRAILQRLSELDGGTGESRSVSQLSLGAVATAADPSPGAVGSWEWPANMPPLTSAELAKIGQLTRDGAQPIWAVVKLDQQPMPAVRAFQLLLAMEDLGNIVRSWPSEAEVEQDVVGEYLHILSVSKSTLQAHQSALSAVPDAHLQRLDMIRRSDTTAASPELEVAASLLAAGTADQEASLSDAEGGPTLAAKGGKSATRTVRVDVEVLDNLMNLVGELVIDRTRLTQVLTRLEIDREGDEMVQIMNSALAHIARMTGDLQDEIQRARMLPVDNLFRKFPRMVRDTAHKANREINLIIRGEETELDRSVIEEIGDPLMHLIRNAIDHGIEPPDERQKLGKPAQGSVTLEAFHEENHIIIAVRDDGRGMDPKKIRAMAIRKGLILEEAAARMQDGEVVNLVWAPGFSTAEIVSDISGRGVGLDVVQKNIEKLNGSVEIKTELGQGTEFRIKLPLTLAIIRSLQVLVQDAIYCIPLNSVVETDRIPADQKQTVRGREVIVKRGEVIPLLRLVDAFELQLPAGEAEPSELFVVIVSVMGKQIGIVVDSLVGEGDVVIKPLGKYIGDVPGISGATIMGDGDVAIILDISSLVKTFRSEMNRSEASRR